MGKTGSGVLISGNLCSIVSSWIRAKAKEKICGGLSEDVATRIDHVRLAEIVIEARAADEVSNKRRLQGVQDVLAGDRALHQVPT